MDGLNKYTFCGYLHAKPFKGTYPIYRVEEVGFERYNILEIVQKSEFAQYKYFIKNGTKYYKWKWKGQKGYKHCLTREDVMQLLELEDNDSALLYFKLNNT